MSEDGDLRAEHDALATRLESRRSVDFVRRGAYAAFFALVTTGLALKLAYDRWISVKVTRFRGPPVFFVVAALVAAAAIVYTVVSLRRARRLMRLEDADFHRFRELRRRLELDR